MTDVPLPFPPHEPATTAPAAHDPVGTRAVVAALTLDEVGDRRDGAQVSAPPSALAPFVEAGVLAPADVHVATALARLCRDDDPTVLLATALAVRAPRRQHVCVDLRTVRATVVAETAEDRRVAPGTEDDDPVDQLPWPDPDRWRTTLAASEMVAVRDPAVLDLPDDAGRDVAPLVLAGDRLYLDRYWRHERRVASALDTRARRVVEGIDLDRLRADLAQAPTGDAPDRQRVAVAVAVTRQLTVVAGGPGTGKTTTVARILRALDGQAEALRTRPPAVALAAPTGKAAARLTESLRAAADPDDDRLREATATTLHRLLGSLGGSGRRFRHGPGHPLPHDVVVVDETSMVDLTLLSRLLAALRDDARVILLGDPHQLASVEAGSVLGDVVGDPAAPPRRSATAADTLVGVLGEGHLSDTTVVADGGIHDALVVLDRVHRFAAGSGVDRFASAVRAGDADAAVAALVDHDDLVWVRPSTEDDLVRWRRTGPSDDELAAVRARVVALGRRVRTAARDGDGASALAALDEVRVLCAHRRGEPGVAGWTARAEAWLAAAGLVDLGERWYLGRPVIVTANHHRLQLWNGDLGVVVAGDDGPVIAFPAPDGDGIRTLAPARAGEVDTVHAMTVHKSQGSQVRHAVVVLPDPASRICTRELLYTAITRARDGATLVAAEAAVRATIATRTQRASGLDAALRPPTT